MAANPSAVQYLPLTGGTITGSLNVDGVASVGGTNTAGNANVLTPANSNGTAAQLSDLSRDYMVYLTVGTAGTALTVAIGPTSSPAHTIYDAATATAGQTIMFRLPAGWYWEWAATTATLALQSAVSC